MNNNYTVKDVRIIMCQVRHPLPVQSIGISITASKTTFLPLKEHYSVAKHGS